MTTSTLRAVPSRTIDAAVPIAAIAVAQSISPMVSTVAPVVPVSCWSSATRRWAPRSRGSESVTTSTVSTSAPATPAPARVRWAAALISSTMSASDHQ